MLELFAAGGYFMWPLSALGFIIVALTLKKGIEVSVDARGSVSRHRPMINMILQVGILSFFLGMLSQAIGLFEALQIIEAVGNVSPAMIAGGLKVSMIAPIYGLIIFLVAFIAWSVLKYRTEAAG